MWIFRSHNSALPPYSEYIGQKLDNIDTNNYLKPGVIYNVSFRVSKGRPFRNDRISDTGHFLKRLSLFLWDEPLKLQEGSWGIKTTKFQKDRFMVNEHNDPSGYLTAEGMESWNLISENFIPEKKLNHIILGSFDFEIDSTGKSLMKIPDQIIGSNSIPDTVLTDLQSVYYLIDSVTIDSIGTVPTCDCDEFDIDIYINSNHIKNKNKCCKIIYVKIDNQEDYCKISDIRYREFPFEWEYINISDIELLQLPNGQYFPIDTICYEQSRDGDTAKYIFEFKPYGKNEYSCIKSYEDIVTCGDCPCDWIKTEGPKPDIYEQNKFSVRLQPENIGRNENNDCCFDLKFFNHSKNPFFVERFRLYIEGGGVFTNTNNELIYERNIVSNGDSSIAYDWFLNNGQLFPWDTISLGTICLSDTNTTKITWDMVKSVNSDNSTNTCFLGYRMMTTELNCDQCCPDTKIYYEIKTSTEGCCINLKSFDNSNCGQFLKFFTINDTIETEINLPFLLCEINEEIKLRVRIYNEYDSLICIKNYDFSEQIENCDCCEYLSVNLFQDTDYIGPGCKFMINTIDETCGFDSTFVVEYGKLNDEIYQSLGFFNFGRDSSWNYTLNNCGNETIIFKIKKDGITVCETSEFIECQTCEDVNINLNHLPDSSRCCVKVVLNSNVGCPFYFKYDFEFSDISESIDLNGSGFSLISALSDTIIICGSNRIISSDSLNNPNHLLGSAVILYYGIYDKFGNLICKNRHRYSCTMLSKAEVDPIFNSNILTNSNIAGVQEIITDNTLTINTATSKYLKLIVYDLNGSTIMEREIINISSNQTNVLLDNLTSGVYSCKIVLEYEIYNKLIRVVK